MNEWAKRRKRVVRLLVLGALIVIIGVPYLIFSFKPASCTDGQMNGDETGVDCGGSCQLLCTSESLPLITHGDPRLLLVSTSTNSSLYEIVVEIENPNTNGEIYRAIYNIGLYSATSSVPFTTIKGFTHVPRASSFIVFEGPFEIPNESAPNRASFDWEKDSLEWQKSIDPLPVITIASKDIIEDSTQTRLVSGVRNGSNETAQNIDLIAIVLDGEGNIVAASKSFLEELLPQEVRDAVFIWPGRLPSYESTEVIVRVLPDRSFLR